MKDFYFQNFVVRQSEDVFKVGTDGVLLGAMAEIDYAKKILEVGTGTGIIALMMAQRNPETEILAIDISQKAAQLSALNFAASPYASRLTAQNIDFRKLETNEKFDIIISNPPYFERNNSQKHSSARQKITLNFSELIFNTAQHLVGTGTFSVILPAQASEIFIDECADKALYLNRKINIFGIEKGTLKRNILEFTFTKTIPQIQDFIIEKSPRNYSDQYLQLTRDFHIFKK